MPYPLVCFICLQPVKEIYRNLIFFHFLPKNGKKIYIPPLHPPLMIGAIKGFREHNEGKTKIRFRLIVLVYFILL